jgi:DNA-binding GntR family transcriptional regulator
MFDALYFAHMQHHALCDALEAGQSVRAEFLMCEHVKSAAGAERLPAGKVSRE